MNTLFRPIVGTLGACLLWLGTGPVSATEILPCQEPAVAQPAYADEQARIYRLIEGQAHHLRGLVKPWKGEATMKLITGSKSDEHHIRPNATAVADFAFLYHFGPYDPAVVGCSRQELLANEIIPMLRYLAATHKTGTLKTDDGKAWGNAWQSAHWAYAFGTAAWWSWNGLPADLQASVRQVVAHEADRIAKTPPPYNLRFDSKSEENAWNSQILSIAAILLADDPRRPGWEKALETWAFSAYCRPADQQPGANIFDDYTLENHGFVHPDYMGAWIMNAGNALDYRYTGRKPLPAFTHNLPGVYDAQKWFLLPDAGYCYPNGQDWALFRNADWIACHATALVEFQDLEALVHLRRGMETAEKMQARNADGAIYAPGENYFASSQPHLGFWLAQAWLVLHAADRELATPADVDRTGVKYFADGKIILRRTPAAIHSVAWGTTVMAEVMPIAQDHILSPDSRNGVGRITVAGKVLPVELKSVEVKPAADGFTVTMAVQHGDAIRADLVFTSRPDGKFQIDETLTALKEVTTDSIETLSFGILNNPNWVYETGKRTLRLDGQATELAAGSGKNVEAEARQASIGQLLFVSDKPLAVHYTAAKKADRSRYTDMLVLNSRPGQKHWAKEECLSKNTVVLSTTPGVPAR